MVLDDYQFISNREVDELLITLLDRMPPQMHLLVATRADPAWPLHRLRAGQQVAELRTDDLRFTPVETESFFNVVMEMSLYDEEINILLTRTEGWIVGLQMAALSMQGITDRVAFI